MARKLEPITSLLPWPFVAYPSWCLASPTTRLHLSLSLASYCSSPIFHIYLWTWVFHLALGICLHFSNCRINKYPLIILDEFELPSKSECKYLGLNFENTSRVNYTYTLYSKLASQLFFWVNLQSITIHFVIL